MQMEYNQLFDFNDLIVPHGEDRVSYNYERGSLCVNISYDDNKKYILLRFSGCSYQYFAPVPGYFPVGIEPSKIKAYPGIVYEISNSDFLTESEAVSEKFGYKPNRRHFFVRLEWAEVAIHVIGSDFGYEFGNVSNLTSRIGGA